MAKRPLGVRLSEESSEITDAEEPEKKLAKGKGKGKGKGKSPKSMAARPSSPDPALDALEDLLEQPSASRAPKVSVFPSQGSMGNSRKV